jgi:hypothetical protein
LVTCTDHRAAGDVKLIAEFSRLGARLAASGTPHRVKRDTCSDAVVVE